MDISETAWWNDLMHGVYGPRSGGARIIIDSEGGSTGVGKLHWHVPSHRHVPKPLATNSIPMILLSVVNHISSAGGSIPVHISRL
jgi:hypothetical protein